MYQVNDEPDEELDLVNDQDEVIGKVMRNEVTRLGLKLPGYVRAANMFLINKKGEIWVPRRTAHKVIAPNGLDYSAGEHVKPGETYLQGMIRGAKEELNLVLKPQDLEFIGKWQLTSQGLPYFNTLFIYHSDAVPDYNTDDFVSYEWLRPEVFLQRIESGEPGKSDLVVSLKRLMQVTTKE